MFRSERFFQQFFFHPRSFLYLERTGIWSNILCACVCHSIQDGWTVVGNSDHLDLLSRLKDHLSKY